MPSIPILPWRARAAGPFAALLASLALTACGGGGDAAVPPPTVSWVGVVAGTAKYGQQMVIAVNGTDVDQGLDFPSASCLDATFVNTTSYPSSTTTAYYRCRVTAVGQGSVNVVRVADGLRLGSVAFTVAQPQVSMTVTAEDGSFGGTMVFTLFPQNAPLTVVNFLNYVNTGFYVGTVFHRVNNTSFVVQGGGYLPLSLGAAPTLKAATFAPVALEIGRGLSNVTWSLGMARDPAVANSATSQFYINVADNPSFDSAFAVFGTVSSGTNVVTAIDAAPCSTAFFASTGSECAPIPNILITAATQTQ
jgi:cyclophilin family peptidyl-prolyl cis-trans isomerase